MTPPVTETVHVTSPEHFEGDPALPEWMREKIEEVRRMPKRIQRRRTKGFNLQAESSNPNGVVYVGRPTRWGNPFWDIRRYGLNLCLAAFENTAQGIWDASIVPDGPLAESWVKWLYRDHAEWLARFDGHPLDVARRELRGKDLACFCPLTSPCHADIWLRLVNDVAAPAPTSTLKG